MILVAFLVFTSSPLFYFFVRLSFQLFSKAIFRIGVTLLFLFLMKRGWPSNCSILHISYALILRTAARFVNYPQQFGAEKMVISFFSQPNSYPSSTTWWERQIKSNQFLFKKRSITFLPQQQLIPLQKLSLQPSVVGLGSDHSISDMILFPAGYIGRLILFKDEMLLTKGLNPPCTQNMRLEMTAAMGKKLKVSEMIFQILTVILLLHSSQKPYSLFNQLDSWLPLRRKKLSGCLILQAMSRQMHSKDCLPRSTQSPKNKQFLLSGVPNSLKMVCRSLNCPWVSPQI